MWVGDILKICSVPSPQPPSGGGMTSIISQSQYESIFPNRNASRYSYANLVSASQRGFLSGFCNGTDMTANIREAAMFLANAGHETTDFRYVCEVCSTINCGQCPPAYNYGGDCTHQYYGRGALQLSWNYNYEAAGDAFGVDFLNNPSMVGFTGDYVFSTAIWFWMYNSGGGCHLAAQNNEGFGRTIDIINGGIECNQTSGSVGYNEMMNRVNRYLSLAQTLGVDPGPNLTC